MVLLSAAISSSRAVLEVFVDRCVDGDLRVADAVLGAVARVVHGGELVVRCGGCLSLGLT